MGRREGDGLRIRGLGHRTKGRWKGMEEGARAWDELREDGGRG